MAQQIIVASSIATGIALLWAVISHIRIAIIQHKSRKLPVR